MKNNNKDHGDATNDPDIKTDEDRGSRASYGYSDSGDRIDTELLRKIEELKKVIKNHAILPPLTTDDQFFWWGLR